MKKTHIIALLMVVAGIAFMVYSGKDLSTFATFEQAEQSDRPVKISGQLAKSDPMIYDPEVDPNFFSFFLIDGNNEKRQVVIREKKRRDFERSEQIVVSGELNEEGIFEASDMLLKCPSKYKEEELALRKQAAALK